MSPGPALPEVAAPDPAGFDIAGVHIGMGPQAVLEALRAQDRALPQRLLVRVLPGPALPGGETVRAIDAFRVAADGSGGAEQVVVLFTRHRPARAYAVAHLLNDPPERRMSREAFADALRTRYGPPAATASAALPGGTGAVLRWAYGPDLRPSDAATLACEPRHDRSAVAIVGQQETPYSAALQISDAPQAGCGIRVRARAVIAGGQVTRYYEDMVGDGLAAEDAAPETAPAARAAAPPATVPAVIAPADPPAANARGDAIGEPQPDAGAGGTGGSQQPARAIVVTAAARPLPPARLPLVPSPPATADAAAALDKAARFDTGEGVTQDFAQALEWYRRAAERGSADAMFDVAIMYDAGRGIARDAGEAAFWYDRAARAGSARASYNLALMYEQGDGVPRDPAHAAALFRDAQARGIAAAQDHLAALTARITP